ncbi:MAG: hypothetical protein U1F57_10600 [bacterium]
MATFNRASNLWHQIVPGRDDSELVFYSRMEDKVEVKRLSSPQNPEFATSTTYNVGNAWDLVFSGRFLQSTQRDVAFYDRGGGKLSICQIGNDGVLSPKLTANIGKHWKALSAGTFLPGPTGAQQFIAYDAVGKASLFSVNEGELKETRLSTDLRTNFQQMLTGNFLAGNGTDEIVLYSGTAPYAAIYRVTTNFETGAPDNLALVQELSGVPTLPGGSLIPRTEYVVMLAVNPIEEATPTSLSQAPSDLLLRSEPHAPLVHSDRPQSLIFYDLFSGLAHVWSANSTGAYAPLSKTMNWGATWSQIVPVKFAFSDPTTLYFYDNRVTVKVNYLRVGKDADDGSGLSLVTLNGIFGTPSIQVSIDALNKAFRPAGIHFEFDRIIDLRSTVLDGMPQHASDLEKTVAHQYSQWLSNPGCLSCVETAGPACKWGVAPSGTPSCDTFARGACVSSCPLVEPSPDCDDKCDSPISAENQSFCDAKCPAPVQRMIMLVRKRESTGSFSGGNGTYVYMLDGSMRHPYFSAHEPGHYFSLSHTHFTQAPTSDVMRVRTGVKDIDAIPANYWQTLATPPAQSLPGYCDESASISIPDSGDCLVANGGEGCTKKACSECVAMASPPCEKKWEASCVRQALNACGSVCSTNHSYTFHPLQYNPMAYGYGQCTDGANVFQFSPEQLARVREHLFKRRPELIQP